MRIGWVSLHRKIIDSRVFANEGLLKVWIYCLCRANHEKNYVPITTGKGTTEVEVNAGEFIFGRNIVAKELKMNPSTLYKRMQKLEKYGNLNIISNTHYSIVSICNWDSYQDNTKIKEQPKEHPSNNQVTAREQPSNTENNVNNDNNENNISPLVKNLERVNKMENPLTIEQGERLIKDYGEEVVVSILKDMENYKNLIKNNVSTNLTARKWIKRNAERNQDKSYQPEYYAER